MTYTFTLDTDKDTAVPIRLELHPSPSGATELRAIDGTLTQVVAAFHPGDGIRLQHMFGANILAAFGSTDGKRAKVLP